MLRYTVLRLLIFFGCIALLWLVGLRDRDEQLLLVVLAAVLSMVISFFALKPFREEYARQLADRLNHRTRAKQARREAPKDEDAEDAETGEDRPEEYR